MSTLTEKLKSLIYPQRESSTEALPKRLFELDSGAYNHGAIKSFISSLKQGDFDPEKVDFDDYKLEGFNLDKLPKDSLVILEYPGQKALFTYSPDKNFFGYTPKLVRQRDGKVVDLHRIPNKQMIEKAINTWVIPLSEFGDRDEFKKKIEARKSNSSDPNKRYFGKELEEKKKRELWWMDRDKRDQAFDKSGYFINREALQEKLKAYRAKKIESGDINSVRQRLDGLAKKYNDQMAEVLGEYQKFLMIDYPVSMDDSARSYFEDYFQTARSYRRQFQNLVNYITQFSENINNFSDEERRRYSRSYSGNLLLDIENGYLSDRLKQAYNRLQSELKRQSELKNQSGATEGLRGQSYTRTLSATEGYFVNSLLRKAAREGLEDLGEDWSDERKSATEEGEEDKDVAPFRIQGWPEPDSKDLYRAAMAGTDPTKIAVQLKLIKDENKMKRRLQAFFDESPNLTRKAIYRVGLYFFPDDLRNIIKQALEEYKKMEDSWDS